jgi:pyrophosphatase PpaX
MGLMSGGRMIRDFEAILFDVDGTLVDSIDLIVQGLSDTFHEFAGRRPDEAEILGKIGRPLRSQLLDYSVMSPSQEQVEAMTSFAINRFEDLKHLERHFPAAVETLRYVHQQGIKTALVTSKSRVELEAFLTRFDSSGYVDAIVTASDVAHPKPDPESAFRACELLGVAPRRAAMIGDSVFDIRCANGAGLTSIAVGYGAANPDTLLKELPDLYFETPEALLAWAKELAPTESCPVRK